MEDVLEIQVEPGIGDFSWIYSKLSNIGVPLKVVVPDAKPRRLGQFLELLPNVVDMEYKEPKHVPGRFLTCAIGGEMYAEMSKAEFLEHCKEKDNLIWFSLNVFLEKSNRLETYLPDVPTNFHYDINISDQAIEEADNLLGGKKDYLLLYSSSYKGAAVWKGWNSADWANFINLYREAFGDIDVVLMGAEWDLDHGEAICNHVPNILNLVGKTKLDVAIEVIKRSSYFVAFPSGLPVLANVVKKPVWMFYPEHLSGLQYSWACPESIESKDYKASLWVPPQDVIKWLDEEYQMKDKL